MEDKTIASIGLDEEYPRRGTPPAQLHLLSLQRAIRERKQDERIHMLRKLRGLSSICYHRYNLWQDRFTYLRHSFRPTVNLPCFFACLFPCFEAPIRRRSDLSTWMLSVGTNGYCHMWCTWCNLPTCENQAPTGATNLRRASMPLRLREQHTSFRKKHCSSQRGRNEPCILPLK